MYAGIERARRKGVPILGTCGGFQHMVVEFARNAAGIAGAGHAESDPDAGAHVIAPLQCSLEGEERIGDGRPRNHRRAAVRRGPVCGLPLVQLRRRSGVPRPARGGRDGRVGDGPDAGTEALELPGHPFYVATLFQPQVGSSESGTLHPLIAALVRAAQTG